MPKNWPALKSFAVLRAGNAAAFTTVGNNNGTELTDARLADWRSGYVLLNHGAVDVTSTDEQYTFIIEGRQTASDAYETLGQLIGTVAQALAGTTSFIPVPLFKARFRLRVVAAGTTPSWAGSAIAICEEKHFGPDAGTIITT